MDVKAGTYEGWFSLKSCFKVIIQIFHGLKHLGRLKRSTRSVSLFGNQRTKQPMCRPQFYLSGYGHPDRLYLYPANRVSFDLPREVASSFPTYLGKIEATLLAGYCIFPQFIIVERPFPPWDRLDRPNTFWDDSGDQSDTGNYIYKSIQS